MKYRIKVLASIHGQGWQSIYGGITESIKSAATFDAQSEAEIDALTNWADYVIIPDSGFTANWDDGSLEHFVSASDLEYAIKASVLDDMANRKTEILDSFGNPCIIEVTIKIKSNNV